jgi:DNA-binding NarL/FixJ family response regulator
MIRVLIVDDQAAVRRGLQMRLTLEPDIEIVGEAGDGRVAIDLARRLMPDVVLMDIEMPLMDGLTAAAALHESSCGPRVVMLSLHDDAQTAARARLAGASALIGKQESFERLLEAIRGAA